jgi:hypothetical protein
LLFLSNNKNTLKKPTHPFNSNHNGEVSMKRMVLVTLLAVILGSQTSAHAALVDNGGNLIYDTDLNITWYDPTPAGMTWSQAMSWAAGLTVQGTALGSWGLPTAPGTLPTSPGAHFTNEGEMGHLYYNELGNVAGGPLVNTGPFTNLQGDFYWSGTPYALNSDFAWSFYFDGGLGGPAL